MDNLSKVGFALKKASPEIFIALGIGGVVGGTILACAATLDAKKRVESYSSYSNYYSSNQTNQNKMTPSYKEENREIIFESRGEAEDLLIQLNEIIEQYHMVSMSDLNDILNITGLYTYTDQKYGWTDLSTATTSKVREGYALRLPRVRALN